MAKKGYLIWYIIGENDERLITRQGFTEHGNKVAWRKDIERMQKSKTYSQIKYSKIK